ncbi:MAG: hypothetical protein FJ104_04510 [Deltaproteobacteria bacterium]|nr:hypothetical protein [Deltaproteobacteria bacterium]
MSAPPKDPLAALGVPYEDRRVLLLLPLIYVGWADGKMEHVEVKRILDVANHVFFVGRSGEALLRGWLEARPPEAHLLAGLEHLLHLAHDRDDDQIDAHELPELVLHAEAVARVTSASVDDATSVTHEEEEALNLIAELLHVDAGITWRKLLDEVKSVRFPPVG